MKVTLHIPPGGTIKQLMAEISAIEPDRTRWRGVSGRAGVLVDEQTALLVLMRRAGVFELSADGILPLPEGITEGIPMLVEIQNPTEPTPAPSEVPGGAAEAVVVAATKKPAAKKPAAKKTAKEA